LKLRRLLLVPVIATGAAAVILGEDADARQRITRRLPARSRTHTGPEARCKGGAVLSAEKGTFLKQCGNFNMYMNAGVQVLKDTLWDTMCSRSVAQRPNAKSARLTNCDYKQFDVTL
jgi:hypothetical protein